MKYLLFFLLGGLYLAGSPRYTKISDVESALTASNIPLVSNGKIGIDISQYNSIDWLKMYETRERIQFIYLRATCGTVPDKKIALNMENIKRYNIHTGTNIGFYHFYKFNQSVPNQIQSFMVQWNKYKSILTLAPVIDVEYNPPVKDNLFLPERVMLERKEMVEFVKEIARLTKKTPIIYTNQDYYQRWIEPCIALRNYPIWLAHYDKIEDILQGSQTGIYNHIKNPIAMIQYSNKGKIESCKGDVDLNIAFLNKIK